MYYSDFYFLQVISDSVNMEENIHWGPEEKRVLW
jgi:hypothetical protein